MLLHKTKGLNPHLTYCPRCHGEAREIVLVGAHDKVFKCPECGLLHIGKPKRGICGQNGCGGHVAFMRVLDDHERLPGDLCEACKEQVEIVKNGGVFFKCKDCNALGAIRDSDVAQAVREQLGVKAPDPCGVEFSKEDCPVCSEKEEQDGKRRL